jgi:hypothetical protein
MNKNKNLKEKQIVLLSNKRLMTDKPNESQKVEVKE